MAEQDGEGDADTDLSAAESTNHIYARAFKDAEEALTYSDSDSYTHTTADEGLFVGGAAYAASGMVSKQTKTFNLIEASTLVWISALTFFLLSFIPRESSSATVVATQ